MSESTSAEEPGLSTKPLDGMKTVDVENYWERHVVPRLRVGVEFESLVEQEPYRIVEIGKSSFKIERPGTGSQVGISRKKTEDAARRLSSGLTLKVQANPKDGGISYTSAVTSDHAALREAPGKPPISTFIHLPIPGYLLPVDSGPISCGRSGAREACRREVVR